MRRWECNLIRIDKDLLLTSTVTGITEMVAWGIGFGVAQMVVHLRVERAFDNPLFQLSN
jgi:hypothetical protein